MPKVICPCIECIYNSNRHTCKANKIGLKEGYWHTINEGFKQFWICDQYEKTDEFTELEEVAINYFGKQGML